eukprot:CAMPEP_0197627214 /NCGR_PEP_ID=MMETSP1338-20131121/5878_1 /TAXON_ID=43686 ORGANISM="Pelagodinium beii, Strain RCC1491" /NCGR_SAMPLE_ID=MMETSP1338 /ASSEMBLY_ACC=CAM_ASM_000754 /LENGTH=557 /DNA_ID=CAMNT_0043197869 /DNA_START=35 /DNA_END=1705 /DNA_ORIENTATION=-
MGFVVEEVTTTSETDRKRMEEQAAAAAAKLSPEEIEKTEVNEIFHRVRKSNFSEALERLKKNPQLWHKVDDDGGHSLLHWAALSGGTEFMKEGIAAGVEVDIKAANKQTPLMWAVIRGQITAAKVLLEAGADLYAQDSMGANSFILAVQHHQHAAMLLMLARCDRDELLRCKDVKGCTPCHWAAYKGNMNTLRLLQYFDADFHLVDGEKMTPLHRAVQAMKDREVYEFLLDAQVDPSAKDEKGQTAMDVAKQANPRTPLIHLQRLLEEKPVDAMGVDPEVGYDSVYVRRKKEEMDVWREKARSNIPCTFWLMCVSLALFEYLTDLRPLVYLLSPYAALAFELGVPTAVLLFYSVMFSDPGKVPARHKGKSAVEEIMAALKEGSDSEVPDIDRLCFSTWVMKGLRQKYCKVTKACVEDFDHFCGWINVAIGKGNHRRFIFLAATEVTTQILHFYLCVLVLADQVTSTSVWNWIYNAVMQWPGVCFMMVVQGVSAPGIIFLLGAHLMMIVQNLTTNEQINWTRYKHFFEEEGSGDYKRRVFKNPFNKGNVFRNCYDFWW